VLVMRGSVQERGDGKWRLFVHVGYGPGGKRQVVTRTIQGSRKEAERALRKLLVELDEGRLVLAKGTFGELAERWYKAAEPGWSLANAQLTRRILDGHVLPLLGEIPLAKLRPADIDAFYAILRNKGLSPSTIARIDAVVRRALTQAVKWDELVANPADRTSPPRRKQAEIRPPDAADVRKLIAAADAENPPFGVYLRLAAATGCRRGELCALQWSDVDLERGSVAITKALEPNGPAGRIKETKTGNRRRLALDAATTAMLNAHAEAMADRASFVGVDLGPWVFSSDPACEQPWHPASVTHWFGSLSRRLKVACRLHDLRHFAATQALDAGMPVVAVSRRLGHARTSTTLDVYGHWIPDTDAEVAGTLGRLLDG
jgi:integrase